MNTADEHLTSQHTKSLVLYCFLEVCYCNFFTASCVCLTIAKVNDSNNKFYLAVHDHRILTIESRYISGAEITAIISVHRMNVDTRYLVNEIWLHC